MLLIISLLCQSHIQKNFLFVIYNSSSLHFVLITLLFTLFSSSMNSVEMMFDMGIYIHDLSMYGVNRDMVLLGSQKSKELTTALQKVILIMILI